MTDNSELRRLRRWYRSATVRRLELVALGSTTIAFALTVWLAGSAYAVESNPLARELLSSLGWIGAGSLALLLEGAIFEVYRRLERSRPIAARLGGGLVAVIGVADVLVNLWVLSRVGVPDGLSVRLIGAIAIVTLVALGVGIRHVLLEATSRTVWGNERGIRTVAVLAIVIVLSIGGIGPFAAPVSPVTNGSAGTSGDDIYIGTSNPETVQRLDSKDGSTVWNVSVDGSVDGDGVVATNSYVYAGTNPSGGGGKIYKFHPENGTTFTTYTAAGGIRTLEKNGDFLYAGLANGDIEKISIADLSLSTTFSNVDTSANGVSYIEAGADGYLYVGGYEGNVEKISTDGAQEWEVSASATVVDVSHSEIGIAVMTAQANNAAQFRSLSDGSQIWAYDFGNQGQSSAISPDGSVIWGTQIGKVVQNGTDGSAGWTFSTSGDSYGLTSGNGQIYAGTTDGSVYSINLDGSEAWENDVGSTVVVAMTVGPGVSSGSSSTYKQTFTLEDRSGLFPPDRALIEVYERQGAADFDSWKRLNGKGFDSDQEATFKLEDQHSYRVTVTSGGNSWEIVGFIANESDRSHDLVIGSSVIDTTTPTPTVTPAPTATPGVTPFPTSTGVTPAPTPTSSTEPTGPVYLGECSEPGTTGGISIEYWDPSYSTESFDYAIENDTGTLYEGTVEPDEPLGYYRGCVGENVTNVSDPAAPDENVSVDYGGGYDNGSSFDGSIDFSDAISSGGGFGAGGPVGSGSSSSATTWGGWLLLLGGGYVAYRRFGNGELGQTVSSVSDSVTSLLGR